MIQKLLLLFVCLIFISITTHSQNRGNIWCFGDSAGIDFNNSAVPISSSRDGRGSSVSIADSNGQLLFYAGSISSEFSNYPMLTRVYNPIDSLMSNGDSIRGSA